MAKVFLSYAREDAAAAKQLAGVHRPRRPRGLVGPPDPGRLALLRRDRPRAQERRSGRRPVDRRRRSNPPGCRTRPPKGATPAGWFRSASAGAGRRSASASSTSSISATGTARRIRRRSTTCSRRSPEDRGQRPSAETGKPRRRSAEAARLSICVLPFVNMSGDPEQEYFSDGITEDIITDLSKVSALSVVARNTAFTFKGKVDRREGGRRARSASAMCSKAACARPATGSGSPPS